MTITKIGIARILFVTTLSILFDTVSAFVTYTITPDSGFKIDSVMNKGENVNISVSDGAFTAPVHTDDAVLTVRFR